MKKKFRDSAKYPIIAIDFDGTINVNGDDNYPECGEVRKYTKEVINFMHDVGIKIVIWTSRDVAYNQEEKKMYDHLTPMLKFLDDNDIHYDAINKSVQFAPYAYNGRKVYAHLYVDDRGYGWDDSDYVMVGVLMHVLCNILGISEEIATSVKNDVTNQRTVVLKEYVRDSVQDWR